VANPVRLQPSLAGPGSLTVPIYAATCLSAANSAEGYSPTRSSWLNLAERWFAKLASRKLRGSAHRNVTELEADIGRWIKVLLGHVGGRIGMASPKDR
jgi:hypothetical protein